MTGPITGPILLAVLLMAQPFHALAQEAKPPACIERCVEMEKAGELREGMSLASCRLRVCQEEGRVLYQGNRFGEALAALEYIQEPLAQSASFRMDLGLVHYSLYRFEDALHSFDLVLLKFPQSVRGAAQRAHTLLRLDRIPEARAQFDAILGFEKADAEFKNLRTRSYVRGNLGVIRLREGDLAGGKRELSKALEIDGRNRLARTYLDRMVPELEAKRVEAEGVGMVQTAFEEFAFGRGNAGVKILGQALQRWPKFKLAYELVADTQRRYGNYPACEDTLLAALSHHTNDLKLEAERIRCSLLRKGVKSMASVSDIEQLRQLAERDPNNPLVQEILLLLDE